MKLAVPDNFVIPEYVKSIEFIEQNMSYIESEMSSILDGCDIDMISNKMTDLMQYRPVVNDMYASAKFYLNAMRKQKYADVLEQFTSTDQEVQQRYRAFTAASIMKDYIKTLTADFEWLYDKCERLNASLTHYLDECRSLLSKEKELLRQTK